MILEYPAGQKTPYLLFDGDKGTLKIEGRCIPEFAQLFFEDLNKLIDDYSSPLSVSINLEFFNTATAKELVTLFNKFKKFPTTVNWLYEKDDEDMIGAGNDFAEIFKDIKFTYTEIER